MRTTRWRWISSRSVRGSVLLVALLATACQPSARSQVALEQASTSEAGATVPATVDLYFSAVNYDEPACDYTMPFPREVEDR